MHRGLPAPIQISFALSEPVLVMVRFGKFQFPKVGSKFKSKKIHLHRGLPAPILRRKSVIMRRVSIRIGSGGEEGVGVAGRQEKRQS